MLKIYKSSAGSGKTYTLVREYLRLAFRDPQKSYRAILAITFTNKAAAEMKSRIIEALEGISKLDDEQKTLINDLCNSLTKYTTAATVLYKRASTCLLKPDSIMFYNKK